MVVPPPGNLISAPLKNLRPIDAPQKRDLRPDSNGKHRTQLQRNEYLQWIAGSEVDVDTTADSP